jgi:uncharacterized membrane protein
VAKDKGLDNADRVCEIAATILAVALTRDGESSEITEAKRLVKCRAAVSWARSLIAASKETPVAEGGCK